MMHNNLKNDFSLYKLASSALYISLEIYLYLLVGITLE